DREWLNRQSNEGTALEIRLENVVFVRPAVVGSEPLEIHIALEADESGTVDFEVYSGTGDDAVVHSQGRATVAWGAPPAVIDLTLATPQHVERDVSSAQFYAAFGRTGFALGPPFRCIERL